MGTSAEVKEIEMDEIKTLPSDQGLSLGFRDYTKERRELFKNITPEDVLKGIEEMRKQKD